MTRTTASPASKKVYAKPTLTTYGTVAAMTRQHAVSNLSDAGNNSMSPFPS